MADENEESHHTDEYECPLFLMARRGAAITLEVGAHNTYTCKLGSTIFN